GRPPGIRIARLVDVAEHDVEVAIERLEAAERVAHVVRHAVREPGSFQVPLTGIRVRLISVGAVDLSVQPDRTREPVRRVAEPRTELHHAPGADRSSEDLEGDADVPTDDREMPTSPLRLHLQEHRLIEAGEPRSHVRIEPRVDDVHALTLPEPGPALGSTAMGE